MRAVDISGQVFGRFTVLRRDEGTRQRWVCLCECGKEKSVYGPDLKTGKSLSCGCLRSEQVAQRNKDNAKHGMFGTGIYSVWSGIVQRCENPNSPNWDRYGARGIKVCERWRGSFEAFMEDVGPRPDGATIGRIDNDGDYSPDNCRWETAKEQANNRCSSQFITINGETKTLAQWADYSGVRSDTLSQRIFKLGWDPAKAISTPARDYVNRGRNK